MTAEVAILNRNGVALAADSAVTVTGPTGTKIYNSVNKLFALSTHAPVGVMVYGSGELTSVPWETIVKVYRRRLGERRFPRIADYAKDLLTFLDGGSDLFPSWQQESELLSSFHGYCVNMILSEIDAELERRLTSGTVTQSASEVRTLAVETIREHVRSWGRRKALPGRSPSYSSRVLSKWSKKIDQVIVDVFGKFGLPAQSRGALRRIAGYLYARDLFNPNRVSGLVVAGFGETEHFPSLVRYDVEGIVLNRLKYRAFGETRIGQGAAASVIPFAQREMVDLFMSGLDPDFRRSIAATVEGMLKGMPELVLEPLQISASSKKLVTKQMDSVAKSLVQVFQQSLRDHSQRRHVDPIVQSVGALPKEELAAMAESLVNLTSFKRHVTHDLETVGGPIDVAVISKGDGFVWIKRKHYFDPALNARFLANYK